MGKDELRRLMRERRLGGSADAGSSLAAHLFAAAILRPGAVLAGYWPLPGEVDIRPALIGAAARGHTVLLPVTPPRGQSLSFRRWQPGAALRPGRFGTCEPDGDPGIPDILLVPLLAFDRAGRRLGYGGGYYDRTLAALDGALAVGCGFAIQEVDRVPTETHDRTMDAIVTETGVIVAE